MKINVVELVKRAVAEWKPRDAIIVCDALRQRGLNYDGVYDFAFKHTGVSPQQWDALLYEGDTSED